MQGYLFARPLPPEAIAELLCVPRLGLGDEAREDAGNEPVRERAAVEPTDLAAVAVSNAQLFAAAAAHGEELGAAAGLEASTEIAMKLGGARKLPRVLELVGDRARALVGARTVVVGLVDGSTVLVGGAAGEGIEPVHRLIAGPQDLLTTTALHARRAVRLPDVRQRRCGAAEALGAMSALAVPLRDGDHALGVLAAFDRVGDDGPLFTPEDERLLLSFAVSAASAVAGTLDTARELSRRSIRATEQERGRFARELHDATVQELCALKMSLSRAAREQNVDAMRSALTSSANTATELIDDVRRLITDLRPAALDQFGLAAALDALVTRIANQARLEIGLTTDLAAGTGGLSSDLEAAAYRIVQEALTNSMKHACAKNVEVRVVEEDGCVRIRISDDGRGFDTEGATSGFGMVGMRERVGLLGELWRSPPPPATGPSSTPPSRSAVMRPWPRRQARRRRRCRRGSSSPTTMPS